jgi:ADP-ribose pyrophosphatase YjhB (NUDIX family)
MKISTIVFLVWDDCIFLAKKKRGFGVGFLNGYGGKKQPEDVTVEDTAIRELKEEAGVITTKQDLKKVAVIEFFEDQTRIFECHIFFCYKWHGDLCETEEMATPEMYKIDKLPFDNMWHADKVWMPIICSGQKIRAKSYYNKGMTRQERFERKPLDE